METSARSSTFHTLLQARWPVSLRVVARSHGWSQLLPFEWDDDDSILYRTEQIGDSVVQVQFSQADGGAIHMGVQSSNELSDVDQAELVARARWMLALDEELDGFYKLCQTEPRLTHVPVEGKGRILRSASVFEDAVKCICTTNTTWAQTKGMVRRLVERLGTASPATGKRAFPDAAAAALAGEGVLADEVRLGYRAPYVHLLAQSIVSGELDLEALRQSSQDTAGLRKELLRIKGIGPYAAATLLILLGRYDYIGVDSWARKLVSKQFYGGQPVGDKEIQAAFARFGRWRALAYWFYRYDEM
jgi:3-methyladenine DNA glycosylase/8-oxoguanine DNA glycosylase